MSPAQRLLAFLVILSVAAVALRAVSHRARIPYPVVLAAGGVLVGLIPGGRPSGVGSDLILLAFVPGLVFQASISLDLGSLRRVVTPVTLLATLGVAIVVVGAGAGFHLLLGLRWPDSFLLAAILAPTDPIAVVSVLRAVRAPVVLVTSLEGESLFNDGTGVALFAALLASVTSGNLSLADVGGRFLLSTGGGLAIGAAAGLVGVLVLRTTKDASLEFLTTLTLAYGAYLAADILGTSGIVAVVAAALVVVIARRRSPIHGEQVLEFWDLAGFLLNALLFLLIGSALPTRDVAGLAGSVAVGLVILIAVRVLAVYAILAAVDRRGRLIAWRQRPFVVWAGFRGALSVALALSVTGRPGIDAKVPILAYGVVVLSLLFQGSTIRPLARRLSPPAPAP
ncbi:MAG: cation:proton antiporter [Candidatus Dormibacter sp.]